MNWFYIYEIVFGIPSALFLFYMGIKYIIIIISWCECKVRGWE